MILLAVFILVVVAVGGLILIDQVDPSSLSLQKKVPVIDLCFGWVGVLIVVGVVVLVYTFCYHVVLFTLGDNMPAVSYDVKSEDLFKEIKSEEGRVFLVRSGTSYYYHCDSDDELKHIPSSFVEEIKIDKGNTRRVQLLSAKFKKKWYQIVLFAFGPFPLEERYRVFLQEEREIAQGDIKKYCFFQFQK